MGTDRKTRIVTTTAVFQPGYPGEDAADRLARLGFEALDMALDALDEKDGRVALHFRTFEVKTLLVER